LSRLLPEKPEKKRGSRWSVQLEIYIPASEGDGRIWGKKSRARFGGPRLKKKGRNSENLGGLGKIGSNRFPFRGEKVSPAFGKLVWNFKGRPPRETPLGWALPKEEFGPREKFPKPPIWCSVQRRKEGAL